MSLAQLMTRFERLPGNLVNPAAGSGYRADIDGLRTLAVLPVVFNHAGLRGFSGGYVGVDVFFVISGYLITGILVRDLAMQRHSIADFYRRRVLRIFPALFAMLAAVAILSAIAMMPGELVRLGKSQAATAFSVSNVLFFSESGYFDIASRVKPLLHTWSLAIEEQFYVLWPLLLAAVGVTIPGRLRAVVAGVTLASFAAAVWMVWRAPSAAFFLLPARAWELGLGGMLAIVPHAGCRRWLNEALGVAGLLLILGCVWRYNDQTAFPGGAAALPCIGAALLIVTGGAGTLVSRLMSIAPAVFIGRISYSLYLWHWPVIVFSGIWLFLPTQLVAPSGLAIPLGQVAVSILLAWTSWRWIELPFRGVHRWSNARIFAGAGVALTAASAVSIAFIASGGLAFRFTPRQVAVAAFADRDQDAAYRRDRCFLEGEAGRIDIRLCLTPPLGSKPVILLAGDSFAAHLWPGLSRYAGRYTLLQANMAGCAALIPQEPIVTPCQRFNRRFIDRWVAAHPPTVVLIAARWVPHEMDALRITLAALRRRGDHVVVIGSPPVYAASLPRLLVVAERTGDPALPQRTALPSIFAMDEAVRRITIEAGYRYVSPLESLCREKVCRTWAAPGVPLQFDYGHLTSEGSTVVVDAMMPAIDAAVRRAVAAPPR